MITCAGERGVAVPAESALEIEPYLLSSEHVIRIDRPRTEVRPDPTNEHAWESHEPHVLLRRVLSFVGRSPPPSCPEKRKKSRSRW